MIVQELIFYAFSLVLVFAAVSVITARNPVYSVLFLILAFFSAAAIWMLLEAEFLAIILVVVYVGAVMVLFLFVVMMLDINLVPFKEGFIRYLPVAVLVASCHGGRVIDGDVEQGAVWGGDVPGAAAQPRWITAIRVNWVSCCTPITCCRSRLPVWYCWLQSSLQLP